MLRMRATGERGTGDAYFLNKSGRIGGARAGDSARFVEHVLGDEDGDRGGDAEGDGVARTAVDLHDFTVAADENAGVERVVLKVVNLDPVDDAAQLFDHVGEQVVGERAGVDVALEPAVD